MRHARFALVLTVLALVATGCVTPASEADTTPSARPSRARPVSNLAAAGGACLLFDYAVITATVGTTFNVAAGGQDGDTFTCAVRRSKQELPDLLLSVTPTDVDAAVFDSAVAPKGGTDVSALGLTGYALQVAAKDTAGPAVEIGWLAGNGRMLSLRYEFPPQTPAAEAKQLTPRLVELAKQIDRSSA